MLVVRAGLLLSHPLRRIANGANGVGGDLVILDPRQLRREDAQAAGRKRRRESDQPRLVHAQMVDAVEHNQRRRIGMIDRRIKPRSNWAVSCRNGQVASGDSLISNSTQHRWFWLIGNQSEYGGGFKVCPDKRLGDQRKHEQREQQDPHRELRTRGDGLTAAADAVGKAAKSAGLVGGRQGSSGRGGGRG